MRKLSIINYQLSIIIIALAFLVVGSGCRREDATAEMYDDGNGQGAIASHGANNNDVAALPLPSLAELDEKYKDATEEQLIEAFTRAATAFIQSSQQLELRQHTLQLSLSDRDSALHTEKTRELRAKIDALELEIARARQTLINAFDEVPEIKKTRSEIARDTQALAITQAERDYLRDRITTLRKAKQP